MPTIKEIADLLIALKPDISDDFRCQDSDMDDLPGMTVTIGYDPKDKTWSYQTGDNSYSGSCYHYPYWAVVSLYRRSNSRELALEVINQILDQLA